MEVCALVCFTLNLFQLLVAVCLIQFLCFRNGNFLTWCCRWVLIKLKCFEEVGFDFAEICILIQENSINFPSTRIQDKKINYLSKKTPYSNTLSHLQLTQAFLAWITFVSWDHSVIFILSKSHCHKKKYEHIP